VPYLSIAGLAKDFGTHRALADVDLAVERGRLVAILGSSGSGKTTLLRLICGFERADAGTIAIDGTAVSGPGLHVPPQRRRVGYVAQEGALFPHLSVGANVAFGLPRAGRMRARSRVDELLELVGLSPTFVTRAPHTLSGGEQQRVALARALAPAPALVLLDEPFSALDAALRAETREAVARALAGANATALLVTHDQAEALSLGEEVAVLRDGRLVQVADPMTLYRRPRDARLACFVGEAMLLPGTARDGVAVCALGSLALVPGVADGPCQVLIRPEQLELVAPGTVGARAARVERIAYYGYAASVSLALVEAGAAPLSALVPGDAIPSERELVGVRVRGAVGAFPSAS